MQPLQPTTTRALRRLVVFAAVLTSGAGYSQTSKPAGPTPGDMCSGVMKRLNEARKSAAGGYIKALMATDDSCLGLIEHIDKARMITRGEYVKAFKHQPDCSASAYSYMCD